MKDQLLGLNISLLVHGIILAALLTFGQGKIFENKPVVIDLSIVSRDFSSGTAVADPKENRRAAETYALPPKKILKSKTQQQPRSDPKPVPHKVPAVQKVKPVCRNRTQPMTRQTVPISNNAPVVVSGTHETIHSAGTNRSTPGVMTGLNSWGQNEGDPEGVGKNYINIHFSYLRDRIKKNLYYPTCLLYTSPSPRD